jgi:hypothetical protein
MDKMTLTRTRQGMDQEKDLSVRKRNRTWIKTKTITQDKDLTQDNY